MMKKLIFSILLLLSSAANSVWNFGSWGKTALETTTSVASKVGKSFTGLRSRFANLPRVGKFAVVAGGLVLGATALKAKSLQAKNAIEARNAQAFTDVTPENTTFVFDFHDVLAERKTSIAAGVFFKEMSLREKGRFLSRLAWFGKNRITKSDKAGLMPEHSFVGENDNSEYKEKATKLFNCFGPSKEGIALVKKLKSSGYQVYICSNIGEESLQYLADKHSEFKELLDLVDGVQQPTKSNNFINKKDQQTYKEIATKVADKNIILVDDSEKKLKVAKAALGDRLKPVQFISLANLTKLLADNVSGFSA